MTEKRSDRISVGAFAGKGRGSVTDTGHSLHRFILLRIETLLHGKSLDNVEIDHLTGLRANDTVRLALCQCHHGVIAHVGRHDAVTRRGCAAALNVTQNRHTRVKSQRLVDLLADLYGAADALGHNDHEVCFAAESGQTGCARRRHAGN